MRRADLHPVRMMPTGPTLRRDGTMASTDKESYRLQREAERAWLTRPVTTGVAISLLATNLILTLLIVYYVA
jgi:hypothetical protein